MPQLGETVTEGTILRWMKQVGEPVQRDEVLFEVSTDKVDSEVPSPAAGYLTEILVPEGETVEVGVRLAVIADSPEGPGTAETVETGQRQAETGERQAETAKRPVEAGVPPAAPGAPPAPEVPPPLAASLAPPAPTAPRVPPPAAAAAPGATQPRTVAGGPALAGEPLGQPPRASGDGAPPGLRGRLLSPVVRRLLTEHGIDPEEVTGTGPGGRITRSDVLSVVDARAGSSPQPAPAVAGPSVVAAPIVGAHPTDEVVPFTNIRRRTAEHMVRSKATSAHTLTAVEVDFENVERVRRSRKDRFRAEEGISLTYLPFVARSVSDALHDFPRLNASVGDDVLILHRALHLGVAVDLEGEGLIVPVVHDAGTKRLAAMAHEIVDLADRARSRRLGADDIAGGTFTITNPGPFATFFTVPIINQPQVAILSTDGVKRRPVVVTAEDGSEAIAVHPVGILALSYDHRAVDGAYASGFLSRLREMLETRDWDQEL
jgi:pyruvate/2-oxoglutarate dehydrogenase complex dihydrolipoamide acyltransferase (E2) component